jgi:hypothetical protein
MNIGGILAGVGSLPFELQPFIGPHHIGQGENDFVDGSHLGYHTQYKLLRIGKLGLRYLPRASKESITFSKTSKRCTPTIGLPFTRKAGVPLKPASKASCCWLLTLA